MKVKVDGWACIDITASREEKGCVEMQVEDSPYVLLDAEETLNLIAALSKTLRKALNNPVQ